MKNAWKLMAIFLAMAVFPLRAQDAPESGKSKPEFGALNNRTINGFRPIWFDLGQRSEYGSKYSGGLGTYSVKHRPMAIYDEVSDRTYFVYGGTTGEKYRHLLCMISCYDHKTGLVQKPVVVYDKGPVKDPHDNPAILIDGEGYIWVYVAGRGNKREGYRYRSTRPRDISEFECKGSSIMAYPQPYYMEGKGHFLFFTRYDGKRQLFFQTSEDGVNWSAYTRIASIMDEKLGEKMSGHYQITGRYKDKLVTVFNRHLGGDCDTRTNIYYLESSDFGKTWTTADGKAVELPVTQKDSPARILELEIQRTDSTRINKKSGELTNCYIKDVNFDSEGNAIILYLTSHGPCPGPKYGPVEWYTAHWNGKKWEFRYITSSTHNYDSGSIYVNGREWTVIAPTGAGPQKWGQGGEIESWTSRNNGKKWKKQYDYTINSPRNNSYVRRPENAKDPFYAFWADGNTDAFSISYLYFGDSKGNCWKLPYRSGDEWIKPQPVR